MPVEQRKVGKHIYLFARDTPAQNLLITSHGGQYVGHTLTTPKNLVFYVAMGEAMTDETVDAVIRDASVQFDPTPAGTANVQDYDLTKYQTDEGEGPETYASLLDAVRQSENWDILSVRNRKGPIRGGKTISLSYVLDKLRRDELDRFQAYTDVHCSFCRVP